MRLSTQVTHALGVLSLTLACAVPALAGALPPCVKAVSSNNGSFLVISDVQLEPGHGNGARVQQVSLHVFPKENFINAIVLNEYATDSALRIYRITSVAKCGKGRTTAFSSKTSR